MLRLPLPPIGSDLRRVFVVPVDQMIVHATEDRDLPPPRATVGWPRHQQRDLSRPSAWNGYVGLFAMRPVRFAGFYDAQADAGMAALSDAGFAGTKVFAFSASFDRRLFTDDGSDYAELWVGAQPTFWDDPPLNAGDRRVIRANWMPLQGLGDLAVANESGALGVQRRAGGALTVSVVAARVQTATPVRILLDGREVFRSAPIGLRPDLPLTIELPPGRADGTLRVEAGEWALEVTTGS